MQWGGFSIQCSPSSIGAVWDNREVSITSAASSCGLRQGPVRHPASFFASHSAGVCEGPGPQGRQPARSDAGRTVAQTGCSSIDDGGDDIVDADDQPDAEEAPEECLGDDYDQPDAGDHPDAEEASEDEPDNHESKRVRRNPAPAS